MDVRRSAILILLVPALMAASPFVAGRPEPLSIRLVVARAAVVAQPDADGWRITAVVKDATGRVQVGSVIRPQPAPPAGASLVLLLSFADRPVDSTPLSVAAAGYVRDLPPAEAPFADRLGHAVAYVENADPFVAADAFAELAAFERAEVATHRRRLDRDRLAAAIDDPLTPPDRCGLYGDLLGLCGRPDDALRLRSRLTAAGDPFGAGTPGLAAAYLSLSGDDGLTELAATVLPHEISAPRLVGLLDALAFHRRDPASPLSPERLRTVACGLLARPDAADLAVGHLLAVRDWAALPAVRRTLETADPAVDAGRSAQVAAVRYLLACRTAADAAPSDRAAASAALARVARDDVDLLRRAQRLAGEMSNRRGEQ